jgi:hypothetical protein
MEIKEFTADNIDEFVDHYNNLSNGFAHKDDKYLYICLGTDNADQHTFGDPDGDNISVIRNEMGTTYKLKIENLHMRVAVQGTADDRVMH